METRIVTDRTLLLGLDGLFRRAMKQHEAENLLDCARDAVSALDLSPSADPPEGYYAEQAELAEYFRLMRGLQSAPIALRERALSLASFVRLQQVAGSGLFGSLSSEPSLLPRARNCLTDAMESPPLEWNVPELTRRAQDLAHQGRDFSLVTLSCLAGDAVAMAGLSETSVLYTEVAWLGIEIAEYRWQVSAELSERAGVFVSTFNDLFPTGPQLPPPDAGSAEEYWEAADDNDVGGRCVRLGTDGSSHYHWAVAEGADGLWVQDFWDGKVWTTATYASRGRD